MGGVHISSYIVLGVLLWMEFLGVFDYLVSLGGVGICLGFGVSLLGFIYT